MSNVFGFVSEDSFLAKMNEQNTLLAAIANGGGDLKPASWRAVQGIVRAGLAPKVFAVGDQFVCQKGGENGTTLIWDVIGFDRDKPVDSNLTHSMALQMHNCYKNLQFCNREAFYCCTSVLPVGTYKFTVQSHLYVADAVGKSYRFTTPVEIPAGGQLVFKQAYDATLQGAKIDIFASGRDTTPLETVTMTESTTGIDLGSISNQITDNFNNMDRALRGNNRWKESAIRQLLNSSAEAGSVWKPQNKFARPPEWNATENGFMHDLDADFIEVVGPVTKTTALNQVTDGGGADTTSEKFFLLDEPEVYFSTGVPYDYYKIYSDLNAAGPARDTNRVKYLDNTTQYWWLRSPSYGSAAGVRAVNPLGERVAYTADYHIKAVPVCCIV